jgi:hypothetical protein
MKRKRERKKENKAAQSQEERAELEEKGEIANAEEDERQEAEVTRRVAETDASYAGKRNIKTRGSQRERASGNHWASHQKSGSLLCPVA